MPGEHDARAFGTAGNGIDDDTAALQAAIDAAAGGGRVLVPRGTYRSASDLMLSLLVPVAIFAIPIFDTTLVSVARTLHGRSIAQGGRSTFWCPVCQK